jgi:DNA (cytosine-5)-methyltransferase 1
LSREHHRPRELTEEQRERYRRSQRLSRRIKQAALAGEGPEPLHAVNVPVLDPRGLMPAQDPNGLGALSLFSGGGGLDLGFERAGFEHLASYELLEDAAATIEKARQDWEVHGGEDGDVTALDWRAWRGDVDVVHGGPPCQPFSSAGRQQGAGDTRDLFPEFVRAVRQIWPRAFVAENVPAVDNRKFASYLQETVIGPLERRYHVTRFELRAQHSGVPQVRRRVFFVGFRRRDHFQRFAPPEPTHIAADESGDATGTPACLGARAALGLPPTGHDAPAPTLRSSLTGPRHTTSILSSLSAFRHWEALGIWPNGVARDRDSASGFPTPNGTFRLSVPDCGILQGFPDGWPFQGAVYMQLGQIGNAVPPPLAAAVARRVARALRG